MPPPFALGLWPPVVIEIEIVAARALVGAAPAGTFVAAAATAETVVELDAEEAAAIPPKSTVDAAAAAAELEQMA